MLHLCKIAILSCKKKKKQLQSNYNTLLRKETVYEKQRVGEYKAEDAYISSYNRMDD